MNGLDRAAMIMKIWKAKAPAYRSDEPGKSVLHYDQGTCLLPLDLQPDKFIEQLYTKSLGWEDGYAVVITPERAQEMLSLRGPAAHIPMSYVPEYDRFSTPHPRGVTPDEDARIKRLWKDKPSWYTYLHVIEDIARGEVTR